jgi:hypothetical protein
MRIARESERRPERAGEWLEGDELADADVPATVVCAHCGDADCPGCRDEQTRSGVVAVVPWERPGTSAVARLWATARATTLDAERFFESLPDGPVTPALRFAITCEVVAAASMAVVALVPLVLFAPDWLRHLLVHEPATAVRLLVAGVPGLATLLVAAHAGHGWALDVGARRSGARGAARRALRFGLYATGWDLIMGPLGVVVVALKEGARVSLSIGGVGPGLPGRSARAFLRGCYRLEGPPAAPAMRASWLAAALATLIGAIAVIAAIVVALLA